MNGMSTIVRTVAGWMIGLIVLYSLWLVAYGHLSPGGGFPGGVMIGAGYMLLLLALGKERAERAFPRPVARVLDSVGALAFLALALLGFWLAAEGVFFTNFVQERSPGTEFGVLNAGTVPLANLAIAVKVSMSLVVALGVLAACRLPGGGRFESDED